LGASLLAPVAAAMLCGAGQEEPLGRLGGGTGLRSLSVSVWLKSTEGCAPLKGRAYAAGDAAQWHEGCTLVSGIFRDPPPALWKGQDAVWRNKTSGNDFGLSLSGDGRALFGAGYRHVPDLEGRGPHDEAFPPPRDTTLRSRGPLLDGAWHHVLGARSADGGMALYVDGARHDAADQACCVPGAAPVPAAYAGVDAAYDATERRGCCGSSGRYALEDVPEVLRVGQLYRGCLRAPALAPAAVDADGARRAMSETALEPPPGQHKRATFPTSKAPVSAGFPLVSADFWTSDHLSERSRRADAFSGTRARGTLTLKRRRITLVLPRPPPRYPLYFVAGADEGSQAMRDAFVGGLREDWDLRERRPGDLHPTAAVEGQGRWLTKMRLALRAVADAPDAAAVAVVSDMDLVFFRPVAPAVRRLLADRDVVFQRDAADCVEFNHWFGWS
jgi:hypothetical protein